MFFNVKILSMEQEKQDNKNSKEPQNTVSQSSAYDPDDGITYEWAGRAEGMSFDD